MVYLSFLHASINVYKSLFLVYIILFVGYSIVEQS